MTLRYGGRLRRVRSAWMRVVVRFWLTSVAPHGRFEADVTFITSRVFNSIKHRWEGPVEKPLVRSPYGHVPENRAGIKRSEETRKKRRRRQLHTGMAHLPHTYRIPTCTLMQAQAHSHGKNSKEEGSQRWLDKDRWKRWKLQKMPAQCPVPVVR